MDDWSSIPGRGNDGIFSLRHLIQTGSGAYPTSHPMDIGVKVAGA